MASHRSTTFAIVGGGLAGAEAAKTLRKEGFDGRIVLVGAEAHPPYERPPLSKDYLRAETGFETFAALEPELAKREQIELLTGRAVVDLDVAGRRIGLDDGRSMSFDRLLLATGAAAIRTALPGSGHPWVHVLRTIEDADRLRAAASDASRAIVAGGGWIAAETAASLRQLGLDVTLVVPGSELLEKSLGVEVGSRYTELHRRNGVRVVTGARVVELVAALGARAVRLSTGDVMPADLVVLGFGATPNTELAAAAGLALDNGIVVDERLETSARGVFAAGDVAAAWHPRYGEHLRSEHWDNARRQGRTTARNLLGQGEVYDRLPYFYSDQFDLGMEFVGRTAGADRVLFREAEEGFVALWVARGRATAGLHGNAWKARKPIERLVADAAEIDLERFRDPEVPLSEVSVGAEAAEAQEGERAAA